MTRNNILVGCDPAFRKGGFAICILDENNELTQKTFDKFIHFISWVQNEMPRNNVKVSIENSYLQNVTFNKFASPKQHRNVGMNQSVSEIAYQLFCEYAGTENVKNVSPKEKGRKWTSKDNKIIDGICRKHKITRSKKTWNQDERDAFKLLTFLL
jgi:hypothetical protein